MNDVAHGSNLVDLLQARSLLASPAKRIGYSVSDIQTFAIQKRSQNRFNFQVGSFLNARRHWGKLGREFRAQLRPFPLRASVRHRESRMPSTTPQSSRWYGCGTTSPKSRPPHTFRAGNTILLAVRESGIPDSVYTLHRSRCSPRTRRSWRLALAAYVRIRNMRLQSRMAVFCSGIPDR